MNRGLHVALCAGLLAACPNSPARDGGATGGGSAGGGSAGGGRAAGGGSGGVGGSVGGGAGGGSMGGGIGGSGGGSAVLPRPDGGWCARPGAWVHDDAGYHEVTQADGGRAGALRWLAFPAGFCVHPFGVVGNVRQIRFAPGGELFAASPTAGTTSSGPGGRSAIVVLPDDDGDGRADTVLTWRTQLPNTQGMMFHDGGFWFQDSTRVMREPYVRGQRAPSGVPPVAVIDIQVHVDALHWPKTFDADDQGRIFVTNGSYQGEPCEPARPFRGGVLSVDGTSGGLQVAKGLRNVMYLRCHRDGNNRCFATELARDYSAAQGGREKLIPVRDGDDWGYPCCASKNLPYTDECLTCSPDTATPAASTAYCRALVPPRCSPKCDGVMPESSEFIIGDTPFGLDFIDRQFPRPWDHRVYVALHGAFGTWTGARVVGIAFDPSTGTPLGGSNLPGADAGAMADFLQGWDDGTRMHGRPADVTVSPDGRLFVANDTTGEIFWVAPVGPQ